MSAKIVTEGSGGFEFWPATLSLSLSGGVQLRVGTLTPQPLLTPRMTAELCQSLHFTSAKCLHRFQRTFLEVCRLRWPSSPRAGMPSSVAQSDSARGMRDEVIVSGGRRSNHRDR